MDRTTKPIAVLRGATSAEIQALLRAFVERRGAAVRIAGLIEAACRNEDRACGPGTLQSLADGRHFPLFQDLGEGSDACALDATGVVDASQAVCRDIAAGCDVVLLSKFGKLEAESRSGLIPAFVAAIEAQVPVLTSVSPKFADAWTAFAAPYFTTLPAEAQAIEDWWRAVRGEEVARPV